MLALLFNVLFASAFTLIIKWVQVREREDLVTVGAINYVTAAVLIAPRFFQSLIEIEIEIPAMWCGTWMGTCYFVAFFFVSYAVRHVGAARASVVSSMSLLLPIGVAAWLWNEVPNPVQCFGVVLALVALMLTGNRSGGESNTGTPGSPCSRNWQVPLMLFIFFVLAGSSRLSQRTLHHVSSGEQRPTFLFAAFCAAAIPSIAILLCRRGRVRNTEIGLGIAMGASNILQSHFILLALNVFPGYIVFPISSAGGLIVITLVATQLLGERLTRQSSIAITVGVAALVLLNWEVV